MKLSDLISCVGGDIRITKPVTAGSGETRSPAAAADARQPRRHAALCNFSGECSMRWKKCCP
jgi:hypothetical protein